MKFWIHINIFGEKVQSHLLNLNAEQFIKIENLKKKT